MPTLFGSPPQGKTGGLGGLGGFTNAIQQFNAQNPGALVALGAGIMNRNPAAGFAAAAPIAAQGQRANETAKFLLDKGIAKSPDEALALAQNSDLLPFVMKSPDQYTQRAEAAQRYGIKPDDPRYTPFVLGGDLQGPADAKPPHLETLFDETGNEYKGVWNPATGGYDRMGGVKKTRDKVDEYTRKNRSLSTVVGPEVINLLGNGTTPGKFDALASSWDQAKSFVGNVGGKLIGAGDQSALLTSDEYMSAKNSLKTIIASYLYSVSGATANPGEVETQTNVLMPKPNEGAQSLADKKARIKTMADAVQQAAQMPPDGMGGAVPPPGDGGWTVEEQ